MGGRLAVRATRLSHRRRDPVRARPAEQPFRRSCDCAVLRARDVLARLDRDAKVGHRPASSLADSLANDHGDAGTQALWAAHRARLEREVEAIRVSPPSPGMADAGPLCAPLRRGAARLRDGGRRRTRDVRPLRRCFRLAQRRGTIAAVADEPHRCVDRPAALCRPTAAGDRFQDRRPADADRPGRFGSGGARRSRRCRDARRWGDHALGTEKRNAGGRRVRREIHFPREGPARERCGCERRSDRKAVDDPWARQGRRSCAAADPWRSPSSPSLRPAIRRSSRPKILAPTSRHSDARLSRRKIDLGSPALGRTSRAHTRVPVPPRVRWRPRPRRPCNCRQPPMASATGIPPSTSRSTLGRAPR